MNHIFQMSEEYAATEEQFPKREEGHIHIYTHNIYIYIYIKL